MEFQIPDFAPAAAEILVASMGLLILLLCSFLKERSRSVAYWLTQLTLLATIALISISDADVRFTFGQAFLADPLGASLENAGLRCGHAGVVLRPPLHAGSPAGVGRVLLAGAFLDTGHDGADYRQQSADGLPRVGAVVMCSYALVAINRDSVRSTEAGMKYFVLGALASGLLLYGISMVYGATGSLDIIDLARGLYEQQVNRTVLLFGLVFLVAGIAFKLGVVPFHMWIPDVYHGAPTAVTLLVSTAPKLAAFVMAFRILALGMWELAPQWQQMLTIAAVASIVLGNLAAIAQTNIKRMLAYSGIAHMGFMLLGLVAARGEPDQLFNAYASSLFYVVIYVITTLASFGIILLMSRVGFEAEDLDDFKGLNTRSSWWAAMMAIVMFSTAGIPFFVGFFSKFFVLQTVISAGFVWLAVLAVVASLVGAYFYLRIVKLMYFDKPTDTQAIATRWPMQALLSVNVLAIAALGLAPGWFMALCVTVLRSSFS